MDPKLRALSRAIRIIRREINHELPIQQLAMLLEVSLNEGISMSDLGRSLNMGQGSVSKNVKLLSQFIDEGQLRGFGLLSTEQDLHERRRFVVHTTSAGKAFLEKIAGALAFMPSNGIGKEAQRDPEREDAKQLGRGAGPGVNTAVPSNQGRIRGDGSCQIPLSV